MKYLDISNTQLKKILYPKLRTKILKNTNKLKKHIHKLEKLEKAWQAFHKRGTPRGKVAQYD